MSRGDPVRQGWILFQRTCAFAGIYFTKHSIELFLVETNQLFGSNSNVILTRKTCGHRSRRAAGSKRRALAFYFEKNSIRIWYMFLISKYREGSDLGLCMTLVLAKRMLLRSAYFQRILRPNTIWIKSWQCAAAFSLQVPKLCADLNLTLVYISIARTHAKFVRKIKMLALGKILAFGGKLYNYYRHGKICFYSTALFSNSYNFGGDMSEV